MRYEVTQVGEAYRVWDNENSRWITIDCSKKIASEICNDFNKMDGAYYSAIPKQFNPQKPTHEN